MMWASSRGMSGRLWGASAAALLCLSVGLVAAIGPAEAEKVGVAAAVNPDAFSSLSGSPQSQLSIGKSIFFNERINTTTSGLVQVLLVDGSTFTVAPARISSSTNSSTTRRRNRARSSPPSPRA